MHRALWKLFCMRMWGSVRRLLNSLRTIRGAVVALVGIAFVCFLIFQGIFAGLTFGAELRSKVTPPMLDLAPLALVGLTIVSIFSSAGERAIYFTPSEVDFLFSGPFTRSQLLVYKLCSTVFGAMATALILSITAMAYMPWWPSAVLGIFCSFLFMNSVTLNVALLGQTLAESTFSTGRRVAGVVMLLIVLAGAVQAAATVTEAGWLRGVEVFSNSIPGMIILSPVYTFKMLFAATDWGSLVIWLIPSAAINLALLALAIRLDANYLEAASNVSRKIDQRMRRARRAGAGAAWSTTASQSDWSLPRLPFLGGIGVVTWLQLSCGFRGARGFLFFLVIIVFAAGSVGGAIAMNESLKSDKLVGIGIGAIAYLSFLISMNPPLGFRACGEQIPFFKTLPLRPFSIACGQTLGISLIVTVLQWLLLGGLSVGVGYSPLLLWAAVLAFPYNILTFGLDNMAFLLYPSQLTPGSPGDIHVFGRVMVQSLIKVLCLGLIIAPIAVLGGVAWGVTGSLHAFPLVSLVLLVITDVLLIYLIGGAFRRFDPSLDQIAG